MEEVGITATEEGAAKLVQHFDLRRLWPEDLRRHRVDTWLNRGCLSRPAPDVTFIYVLKCFFLITLGLSVLKNVTLDPTWLFTSFEAEERGFTLLIILSAFVCVRAFVKKLKKTNGSASPRKEEVQTISASIQQV